MLRLHHSLNSDCPVYSISHIEYITWSCCQSIERRIVFLVLTCIMYIYVGNEHLSDSRQWSLLDVSLVTSDPKDVKVI